MGVRLHETTTFLRHFFDEVSALIVETMQKIEAGEKAFEIVQHEFGDGRHERFLFDLEYGGKHSSVDFGELGLQN